MQERSIPNTCALASLFILARWTHLFRTRFMLHGIPLVAITVTELALFTCASNGCQGASCEFTHGTAGRRSSHASCICKARPYSQVGSSIALSPIPSGLCVAILAWPEITCLDIN